MDISYVEFDVNDAGDVGQWLDGGMQSNAWSTSATRTIQTELVDMTVTNTTPSTLNQLQPVGSSGTGNVDATIFVVCQLYVNAPAKASMGILSELGASTGSGDVAKHNPGACDGIDLRTGVSTVTVDAKVIGPDGVEYRQQYIWWLLGRLQVPVHRHLVIGCLWDRLFT